MGKRTKKLSAATAVLKKGSAEASLVEKIQKKHSAFEATMKDFLNDAKKDPLLAFSFVNSSVSAAAQMGIYENCLVLLTRAVEPANTSQLREWLMMSLLRESGRGAPRSTGFLDGPIHAEQMKAYLDVIYLVDGWR